jgi:hypothetical protein
LFILKTRRIIDDDLALHHHAAPTVDFIILKFEISPSLEASALFLTTVGFFIWFTTAQTLHCCHHHHF